MSHYFFSSSCWPQMSQSLWYSGLRPVPLPPAQLYPCPPRDWMFYVYKNLNLILKWGGREQMGTLGKNGAWGDATCTCPRTCVSRPCSSLCMVTRVLALQVWLSICLMVSSREDLLLHSVSSMQAVNDYPNYTWDGLTLNLFCSITFIVNVTHKQQYHFTFQQTLVTSNYFNIPNSTWHTHVQNPSATTNRTT